MEPLSPAALLLAISAVFLVVLLAVSAALLNRRKYGPAIAQQQTSESAAFDRWDPCSAIIQVLLSRVQQGSAASGRKAATLERAVVMTYSDLSAQGHLHGEHELKQAYDEVLQFLQFYRTKHSDNEESLSVPSGTNGEIRFFEFAETYLREGNGPPTPRHPEADLYSFLLRLESSLSSENLAVVFESLARSTCSLEADQISDPAMKTAVLLWHKLSEVLQELAPKLLSSERPVALAQLSRISNDLRELARKNCDSAASPPAELLFLKNALLELRKLVDERKFQESKKPAFEIRVESDPDFIKVSGAWVEIPFLVLERSGSFFSGNVNIFPIVESKDLAYSDGEPRTIQLTGGRGKVTFVFANYIVPHFEFEPRPEVTFRIDFRYLQRSLTEKVTLLLPELRYIEELINPFSSGLIGTGLPGTSKLFVGRRELLRKITSNLLNFQTEPLYFLLRGLARSGKTSVLRQLAENPNWLKGRYLPIMVLAQTNQDALGFFSTLYAAIKNRLSDVGIHVQSPEPRFLKDSFKPSWQRVTELIRENENNLKERRLRILLLVDEYQELAKWEKEELGRLEAPAKTEYLIPCFLKTLRDQYGDSTAVVVAGMESLTELEAKHPTWIQQLGGRLIELPIDNLEKDAAHDLIARNLEDTPASIDRACLNRTWGYTDGQPFLQMLMAATIFKQLLTEDEKSFRSNPTVTFNDIDRAARLIGGDPLKFMWADSWIRDDEVARLLLAGIAQYSYEKAENRVNLTNLPQWELEDIIDYLIGKSRSQLEEHSFTVALTSLYSHGLLKKLREPGTYQLRYPSFAVYAVQAKLLDKFFSMHDTDQ